LVPLLVAAVTVAAVTVVEFSILSCPITTAAIIARPSLHFSYLPHLHIHIPFLHRTSFSSKRVVDRAVDPVLLVLLVLLHHLLLLLPLCQ
jgi:hypothetical protein